MLILKPVEKKLEDLYLKYFKEKHKLDGNLVKELHDYFDDDFYYLVSLLAGVKFDLKRLETLQEWKEFINIYWDIEHKLKYGGEVEDAEGVLFKKTVEDIANKYHITSNRAFCIYNDVKAELLK